MSLNSKAINISPDNKPVIKPTKTTDTANPPAIRTVTIPNMNLQSCSHGNVMLSPQAMSQENSEKYGFGHGFHGHNALRHSFGYPYGYGYGIYGGYGYPYMHGRYGCRSCGYMGFPYF